MGEGIKYFLFFMAGVIIQTLILQPKARKAAKYIFTFRWVHIGISTNDGTRGKLMYHKDPNKTPKGYKRIYPPPHPGGREKGKRSYSQDDKALQMVLDEGMTPRQVFDIMRLDYFNDEIWNTFDQIEKSQAFDAFRNRLADRMEKNY